MKFMKKRKIRRIASLFMAVLMVAALMPGSITNTKADDKTAESGVVVDAGTWENNERTTTWDFSKYSGSSSLTLAEGDEVGRIKVAAGTAYVKTKGAGLSAQKTKDAVIAVPVDPTATSATLTLEFSSNNNNRYVYVGDKSGENAIICLNTAGREELPNAVNINADKVATVTVSSAAFEDGYILLTPDTLASGDSGEMKIKNLTLVESKDNGDRTWNFRKGSELMGSNGKIIQETRTWDEKEGVTKSMRTKEEANDYRYFPEPDLAPFTVSEEYIEDIRKTLPELPDERRERYIANFGLSSTDAQYMTNDKDTSDYFEKVVAAGADPKASVNWIMGEFASQLSNAGIEIAKAPVTPENLAKLLALIAKGTISGKIAKKVFAEMWKDGADPEEIVKAQGLVQISDTGALKELVVKVIANNPKAVEDFKAGKKKAVGALVGQIMKETKGKANPKVINELLNDELKKL